MSAPAFDADSTLGALLIGTLVSYALFGVMTTQVYVYYGRFQDPWKMKAMVGAVWCGELAHTICIAISLYTMVITNYGHPERLLVLPNSLLASTFIGSLVSFGVQVFFAIRIYSLSKSWWIPCICWALSLFRLVPPNVILFAYGHRPAHEFLGKFGPLFDAIWAASAANDLLIAGTLVYLLYRRRSSVFEKTVAAIDKLIQWTIETGVVTSIASIIMLVSFISLPSTFVWLAFFVVIPRLFSNSLMASLNSRAALRAANEPRLPSSTPAAHISTLPRPMNSISIEMNKVTMTAYDD
ncbi:hypothetical protein DFH08DRAFT_891043 [Mycena albidolilacea]|uniref:DUF6534 domain-containing protein n=1 Tax=Mycena albidolilacea TaxID=1033008 RepID=A0AAD7EGU8_9AGAR|nr:hypothetical protein DFH08DRAFT_891043 [Mycena albidolilacea]